MVRITKVYTKTGDQGDTALIGGDRVKKSHHRVECYGMVDEVNATLGLVKDSLATSKAGSFLLPIIERIQNELFNLGALLATSSQEMASKLPPILDRHIVALEKNIDEANKDLPHLKSFVLPGGGYPSSFFHLARCVCRRAERRVVLLASEESIPAIYIQYLNRLSDAFFVFGRYCVYADNNVEPLWTPEET